MPSANITAVKDNATGRLNAGISAATLSIPLQSGNGANFPQPYNGTCSSLGSSITLNSTGISAIIGGSAAVGKPIFNATDGSIAFIRSVATDAVTTTPLLGGTDNTWAASDVWRVDEFILTLEKITTNAYGVDSVDQLEQALIIGRTTDTLTVATGGRGYNSTVAATFDSGAYARLLVSSPNHQRIVDYLNELAKAFETDSNTLATFMADIASTANAKGASLIGVEDAGGNFTGTTVEDILLEIHQTTPSDTRFGSGADGNYTLNASQAAVGGLFSKTGNVFKLLRDANFNTLTIASGYSLDTNGYIGRAFDTDLQGTGDQIFSYGADGGNGGNGSGTTSGTAGAAGAAAHTGSTLPDAKAGLIGLAGAAGVSIGSGTFQNGNNSGNGTAGTADTSAIGSAGANGAQGGNGGPGSNPSGVGGTAGSVGTGGTVSTSYLKVVREMFRLASLASMGFSFNLHGHGGQSSAGASGGANTQATGTAVGGAGGGSGGGGGEGGKILWLTKILRGTGDIRSKGGKGGNGGIGADASTTINAVAGGGGGGAAGVPGNGGVVVVVYLDNTGYSGTVASSGGTAGTGGTFGNGSNSGVGDATRKGVAGTSTSAGLSGEVFLVKLL